MALTRKMLKAMGIEDEIIEQIIEAHTETVDGLRKYKSDAEKLPEIQQQLDAANAALDAEKKDGWKDKFDALQTEYSQFKDTVAAEKTRSAKEKAYRAILKAAGVGDKHLDTLIKVSGETVDKLELKEDGTAKNADSLTETAKSVWSDFIVTNSQTGAPVITPPPGEPAPDTSKMTDSEYFRYIREKKGS